MHRQTYYLAIFWPGLCQESVYTHPKIQKRGHSHFITGDVTGTIDLLLPFDAAPKVLGLAQSLHGGSSSSACPGPAWSRPPAVLKIGSCCAGYLSESIALDRPVPERIKNAPRGAHALKRKVLF